MPSAPASPSPAPSDPLTPRPGLLDLGDRVLETLWVGPGPQDSPTLVLLHEGLGSVSLWRDLPRRLAEATGCGVFAWSRAGYGGSSPRPAPWPLTYLNEEALVQLPRVLEATGLRRAILVGHSDGASIAACYAGTVADPRIAGLVLMAPHFVVEPMCTAAIAETKATFKTTDLRQRLARHHGDKVDDVFWGWNRAWLDPLFATWDMRVALPGIRQPVLVIQGEEDPYGTRVQPDIARQHCGGPVTVEMLSPCGHAPHRDQPEATLAAIAAFARDHGAGDAHSQAAPRTPLESP